MAVKSDLETLKTLIEREPNPADFPDPVKYYTEYALWQRLAISLYNKVGEYLGSRLKALLI